MRMISPEDIAERLRDAEFEVRGLSEWESHRHLLVVEDDDRDELERVLMALAGGYSWDISEAEPGYEVMLQEEG